MAPFNALLVASLAALAHAHPAPTLRRQISPEKLRDDYDFVIVGGGTAGLTVADRLSEAFEDKTVLVIEYGKIEYAAGVFDPPQVVWGGASAGAGRWIFNSLPNPDVDNKTASVMAGQTVGGSSAVNGMFFDRGSRFDFDAWAEAGGPEFNSSKYKWDFEGLFPFYKKAVNFTVPPDDVVEKYGYTWDLSAYGGSTPIYSSFPPFLWGDHHVIRDAWTDLGIATNKECASGDKTGLCWVPISEDPTTARRSYSGLGHYAYVNATRSNYDLLVSHQVVRVVYSDDVTSGPPLVEVRSLEDDTLFNVTAKAEVIISAGALHTPTVLHRSGIGSESVLKNYNISAILDLPGVGSNLQDHSGASVSWNYTKPGNFSPMPSDMLNETFAAEAAAQFDEVPARGPYTLAMSNTAIFVSLPNLTADYSIITGKIRDMVADGSAATYLPADYSSDPTMVAGYNDQLSIIADFLENPEAPSLESGFATGMSLNAINLHQLSRGTVRLDSEDHLAQPILDYRTGSNPIDFDVYQAHVNFLRKTIATDSLQQYGAVEITPGEAAQNGTDLTTYIKSRMTFSFLHPCCTAAMLPPEKGGVVGPDLKVHGAAGLRVVDMSILPFLPSSHLSQLAYAVGEKAADIIIQDWSDT